MSRVRRSHFAKGAGGWVRANANTNGLIWGLRGHLLWGLPEGKTPHDGPRGLIRLWSPVLPGGGYDLINFIAIEPIVDGRRGFSELEHSEVDGVQGKRLWPLETNAPAVRDSDADAGFRYEPGALPHGRGSVGNDREALVVKVGVERFDNGAHLRLTIEQRHNAPDEISLTVHAEADSAAIDFAILTATMGNKARARLLWLKQREVSSLELFSDYEGSGFAPHAIFGVDQLCRTTSGDLLAAITTDEANPSVVEPFPAAAHWRYRGAPVTQYWRKPAGTWSPDLRVAVNGRYTYWMSRNPIPGGIAFENFELRDPFRQDQKFMFGITALTPAELGIRSRR